MSAYYLTIRERCTIKPAILGALFMLTCCCMSHTQEAEMKTITTESILENLDSSINGDYYDFIDLGHGYFELANCRLTLFKHENEWAMVFEKFGYNARSGNPVSIEINFFGNCLKNLPEENGKSFNIEFVDVKNNIHDVLQYGGDSIVIRDQKIVIPIAEEPYKKYGIAWDLDGKNYEGAVLKYLAETHPEATRTTEDEIRKCVPKRLKKIMTLDSWHQDTYHKFEPTHPPSTQETFQMIAKVLVTGDSTFYKPTEKPNTHWSNWLESGKL